MTLAATRTKQGVTARAEERAFFICISPWLLGLLGFTLIPMIASFVIALMRWNLMYTPTWIGLTNYNDALKDPLFWQSLKVTVLYSIVSVPLDMALGLFVAILMNQKIPGMNLFRTIYYMPAVVSGVAVAILWQLIFNAEWGVLNSALWQWFHIQGPRWLLEERWVLPAFIVISLWGVGGGMIVYLAGLQSVPTELYEAAQLDGAGQFARFRYVTLAWISPVIFFNLVMGIIGSFQVFTTSYVMTRGGPNNASLFYLLYLYQNAWQYYKMGYACALAWVGFGITMALTLLVIKSSPAWVYYESSRGR